MSVSCSITEISWTRVHLTVTVTFTSGGDSLGDDVHFTLVDEERSYPVKTKRAGRGVYRLSINVTNFNARKQVPEGTWRFVPVIDGVPGPGAQYDLTRMDSLDQDSRTFLYAQNRTAYVVAFGITESDVAPEFLMRAYQMTRLVPPVSKQPLKTRIKKRVLSRARRVKLANAAYRVSRRLNPPKGNRILFASEMRPSIEGNLARIHDRMVERGLDKQFEFRYSFRLPHTGTKRSTLRAIYLLATSDYVLIDDYFGMFESLNVSPKTKIIQVWHAGSGFKAIGYSRFGNYGSPKLQNAHRKYTYAITGSKHLAPVYAEAFGIEEAAVIPTGLPRIDTFLDEARTEKVVTSFFEQHPNLAGKRIILFAPTFRGRGINDAYYDYSRIDFEKLYEVCGDDSVVLFRMHHFVHEPVPIPEKFADRMYDFASFVDTNDLLHVTDLLITDYSSIIYEFSLLDKPMLFYAYDKDVYAATRGFHRDYDATAPGKVCENFDELIKAIADEDFDTWKIEVFRRENFDSVDTNSGDRVIDWLILSTPSKAKKATSGQDA
jgi:CDP-ribitol ribitolphosphotransferase